MKPRLAAAALAVGLAFNMPSYADSSSAFVQQFGEGNDASVNQVNSPGSFGSVFQSGNDNGGFTGFHTVEQVNSTNSAAQVQQVGNHNTGLAQQFNQIGSSAFVGQQGSNNSGFVQQFSGSDNVGWIFQGDFACLDRNCSTIVSLAPSSSNSSGVFQVNGSHNTGITVQSGGPFNGAFIGQNEGSNNTARIIQEGSQNTGTIQQGGVWCTADGCTDFGPSNGSSAFLNQSGMFQQARIGQFGQASANADQTGMFNELEILQVGLGNQAFSSQHGTAGSFADRNVGKIDQVGNALFAQLVQNGAMNNAVIRQR